MTISWRPFPDCICVVFPVAPIAIAIHCAQTNCDMKHPIPPQPVPMQFFISPPPVCRSTGRPVATPLDCLNWLVDHQVDVLDEITAWMIAPRNLN